MDYTDALYQAGVNNRRLNSIINEFEFIAKARITYHNTTLVNYMSLLYDRAMYNTLQGYWHASPGLIAVLIAIWGVVVAVYNFISYVVELLKLKEILQLAGVLRIVWPKFRLKYDAILAKVSEFSASVGWGADGLIHLIQAAQGGMNMLKGITGKSFEWLQIAGAEKALRALAFVSSGAHKIASDPASVLDLAFNIPTEETSRLVATKWDNTMAWLEDTTQKALSAIQQGSDIIENLQDLENRMPQLIKDFIPQEVWDGINWADAQIDDTILPALTNIAKEFNDINAVLQAERERAEALAAKLMLPGDLLENVDNLVGSDKEIQEQKIDDVTSRFYEQETDHVRDDDRELIEGLKSLQALFALDREETEFSKIECIGRPGILWDKAEQKIGWFVGDF